MFRIQSVAFSRQLLFGLLALSLSLLFSATSQLSANASSPYDGKINVVPNILSRNNSICTQNQDVSLNWYTNALNSTNSPQDIHDQLNNMLSSGYYIVSGFQEGALNGYLITYSTDHNAKLSFDYLYGDYYIQLLSTNGATNNIRSVRVNVQADNTNNPSDCDKWSVSNWIDPSSAIDHRNIQMNNQTFINTFPTVYPDGYGDATIPDSYTNPNEQPKPSIKPDFTYQLDNKHLLSHDYNTDLPQFTPDEGYTFEGYSVEWSIFKCTEYDEVGMQCNTPTLVDQSYKIQNQSLDYTYDFNEYGDYMLEANYLIQQCHDYDGIPDQDATPDYCFYVDIQTEFPDYDFTSTTVHLKVNGQSITGDTKTWRCDQSGHCEDPQLVCYDQATFFDTINCKFQKQLNQGLLNPSITAFKNLFLSLIATNPQCTIPISNVRLTSNQSYPLSTYSEQACTKAKVFRDAFPIAPILINFFLGIITLTMIVRIINKLLDDKQSDIIEGVAP